MFYYFFKYFSERYNLNFELYTIDIYILAISLSMVYRCMVREPLLNRNIILSDTDLFFVKWGQRCVVIG